MALIVCASYWKLGAVDFVNYVLAYALKMVEVVARVQPEHFAFLACLKHLRAHWTLFKSSQPRARRSCRVACVVRLDIRRLLGVHNRKESRQVDWTSAPPT